jgi:hypothetical protein
MISVYNATFSVLVSIWIVVKDALSSCLGRFLVDFLVEFCVFGGANVRVYRWL